METEKRLQEWTEALCAYAGESREFAARFWERLLQSPGIYEEYAWFYAHQSFACQYKIEGVSVVDIMVWQIDHFKAQLDLESSMRTNKDRMVLMAFDTFLRMEREPEAYLARMREQTGTDYPGKF